MSDPETGAPRAPAKPDLLWDCFTNWSEVLREIDERKRSPGHPEVQGAEGGR